MSKSKGATILVVDDNPALQHATRALPGAAAIECVHVSDSIAALCRMVEHRPTTVLIDSATGPLDAWNFSLLVKEHPEYRGTRLVLLTQQADAVQRARAEAAGMQAVLEKPFTTEELQAVLAPELQQSL